MLMSKCGHCGGFRWELHEESPTGSIFKVNFIRCAACKVPIGVTDYYDTHSKVDRVEKLVKTLGDSVTGMLQVIDTNIRRLSR